VPELIAKIEELLAEEANGVTAADEEEIKR